MTNAFLTAPPSPSVMARTAQKKVTRPVHLDYQSFWTTEPGSAGVVGGS